MGMVPHARCLFFLGVAALTACGDAPTAAPPSAKVTASSAVSAEVVSAPTRPAQSPDPSGLADRSASALARSPDGKALFLADEDHGVLRRIPLPVDGRTPGTAIPLPGPPAQVLAFGDRVLVTIREPGMLLELVEDRGTWVDSRRVELPDDAWGLSVSADGKTALVTSAWTHQVSAVDLATMKTRWTLNVAREPRGIAIALDGTAYVSHLVGSRITKIADVAAATPSTSRVEVAPSPLKSPPGRLLPASLGYAAILSPDSSKLFLPRHAIGAQGIEWWFGAATVDVIETATATALAPRARGGAAWGSFATGDLGDVDGLVALAAPDFVQPRAAAYRRSVDTLLIASEGTNSLVELDAKAMDPSLATKRIYRLGRYDEREPPHPSLVVSGGAPSAIALSADETMAWVYCRSTNDLAIVSLDQQGPIPFVHLTDDALGEDGQRGKRLFYDALDATVSGGLACAGCHPDGRDDGHVWHEIASHVGRDEKDVNPNELLSGYRGIAAVMPPLTSGMPRQVELGVARQTPMIAGRVTAVGPYGWRAESPGLDARLRGGFSLHRWQGTRETPHAVTLDRPKWLAAFVREGLRAPKVTPRPLNEAEQRGKALFESDAVGCTACHWPAHGFANGQATPIALPRHPGFDEEPVAFKTPSLLFVGGTPPYYHDGSVSTLEELIRKNGKTMGSTSQLVPDDQAALAAYLRTIGGHVAPFPEEEPAKLPEEAQPRSAPAAGAPPPRTTWDGVEPFARVGDCDLRRQETVLHVRCASAEIIAVAGSLHGMETYEGPKPTPDERGPRNTIVPLRRAERRVLQITGEEAVFKWGSRRVSTGLVQIQWPKEQSEPTISVHVD